MQFSEHSKEPFLQYLQGLAIQCIGSTFEEQLDKSSFRTAALYAIETATHKAIEVALRCAAEVSVLSRWNQKLQAFGIIIVIG
jgi:predicted house-cleaning NTP pyrophosphatase (Maf/HAM1 superfamily)